MIGNRRDRIALCFALFAGGACRTAAPLRFDVSSTADTVRIAAPFRVRTAAITARFRNGTSDTVSVDLCSQTLEYLSLAGWKVVDIRMCAGDNTPGWTVPPHDSLDVPINVEDSRDMQVLIRRGPLVTGQYRLRFQAGKWSRRKEWSSVIHSAPFTILDAPSVNR